MVPHTCIMECLNLVGACHLERSKEGCKTVLTSSNESVSEIFRVTTPSSLLFVIAMIPLTLVLRKVKPGYALRNDQIRINHLLFMDDLTLYGKDEREIESLVQTVRINNEDIAMEFGIQNCACVILKRGKTTFFDGIESYLKAGKFPHWNGGRVTSIWAC